MSSTLQRIRTSVNFNLLPITIDKIWFGFNDQLDVTTTPFATITDFRSTPEYDTGGVVFRQSEFNFHVFARTLELAEELALAIDGQLNTSDITGAGSKLLQQSYEVVQEDFYVFHTMISYKLFETA